MPKHESDKRRWKSRLKEIRATAIYLYGGKCVKCGFSDYRALQFDHIEGGGVVELKSIKNRRTYYNKIIRDKGIGRYQLLCANCNWIKRYEDNEARAAGEKRGLLPDLTTTERFLRWLELNRKST